MNLNQIKAGPDLYLLVRQGFIGQNTSLNRWCCENGVGRRNAEAALKGMWNGPKGQDLRARIAQAARVADVAVPATETASGQRKIG
jgi:hypothetical protein